MNLQYGVFQLTMRALRTGLGWMNGCVFVVALKKVENKRELYTTLLYFTTILLFPVLDLEVPIMGLKLRSKCLVILQNHTVCLLL